MIHETSAPTHRTEIHIAGDLPTIQNYCRKYCSEPREFTDGFCVSVLPSEILYKFGAQSGACINLVNYPRFPRSSPELTDIALDLARSLMHSCHQRTALVQTDSKTHWLHREETEEPQHD